MKDYAGQFNPGFRLDARRVALVVVDMQYASGSRHEGLGRLLKDQGRDEQGRERFDRIEGFVVPTIQRLLEVFRSRGFWRWPSICGSHFSAILSSVILAKPLGVELTMT